jgi:2-polyprenyl-3-methyl-5-hydroxy-6-metoxy-1,4-benzoquinol methylase
MTSTNGPSRTIRPERSVVDVPCALCGARDTRRLYTKVEHGIERCRRCGLVYANPRAPEEAILQRYSREYFWNEYLPAAGVPGGRVDYEFLDGRNAAVLALIRGRSPEGARLLEVGSGAGLFLKAAERAGWNVAGVELSEAGAAFARDTLGLDVRHGRAEAMPFAAGSFDVAVMFDVLEHLFDPRGVLGAVRRALRPGGTLVVTTPNFDALSRRMLGVDWAVISPLEHVYYYTERTLRLMLDACGFRDVSFEPTLASWGLRETMNYRYTHAPAAWRARVYRTLVEVLIGSRYPAIGRWGRADMLLCTATA